MPHSLPHITAAIRASGRTTTHGAILLARIDALTAAIQAHHDTKHGNAGGRSAAVLAPPDLALYTAAGVAHAVLGFSEGLDERRRMVRP